MITRRGVLFALPWPSLLRWLLPFSCDARELGSACGARAKAENRACATGQFAVDPPHAASTRLSRSVTSCFRPASRLLPSSRRNASPALVLRMRRPLIGQQPLPQTSRPSSLLNQSLARSQSEMMSTSSSCCLLSQLHRLHLYPSAGPLVFSLLLQCLDLASHVTTASGPICDCRT